MGSHLNLGAGLRGVLHVEPSNGKRSLFWRSTEREREKGVKPRPGGTQIINSLSTRLALLTKALGIPEGNLRVLAEK